MHGKGSSGKLSMAGQDGQTTNMVSQLPYGSLES